MAATLAQITITPDGKGGFTAIARFDVTDSEWNIQGNHFRAMSLADVSALLSKPSDAEASLTALIGKTVTVPVAEVVEAVAEPAVEL